MSKRSLIEIPKPVERNSTLFHIRDAGHWLILSDIHIPFHDTTTIELALKTAKKLNVKGLLLNGDTADCHELSRFDKTPDDPRYVDEVDKTRQLLAYFRQKLPKARIIWKDGNHEERLIHYLASNAPALFGLKMVTIPNILNFKEYKVEHVSDRRVIRLGKLNVVHGHEYRPGIQTPVNPARGLFLRAKSVAICGHFHQTSEHHEKDITGKAEAAWSTGCACQLSPLYMPLNKWNHSFAIVELHNGGNFEVRNYRVLNGELV